MQSLDIELYEFQLLIDEFLQCRLAVHSSLHQYVMTLVEFMNLPQLLTFLQLPVFECIRVVALQCFLDGGFQCLSFLRVAGVDDGGFQCL